MYGPQGDNWGQHYGIEEGYVSYGPTPLIVAMRAFCYEVYGPEIKIPESLK